MTSLYNCRHSDDQYRITKFDPDFNVESSYLCDLIACECPAGHRPSCRHRDMLPKFIQRDHIGDEWFWDHDRGGWVQGAGLEPTAQPLLIQQDEPIMDFINELAPEGLRPISQQPSLEIVSFVELPSPTIRRRV